MALRTRTALLAIATAIYLTVGALVVPSDAADPAPATLPGGRAAVFGGHHFLVAYYGTPGTGSLGVLGATPPEQMNRRLTKAAAKFKGPKRKIQPVYEVIATVADGVPGSQGAYSHDVSTDGVERYIELAHEHGALVVLDLQPGRSDFLTVAQRWAWALEDPWVGLALDPEWRMDPDQVPGQQIGHVWAGEVNRVSAWLSDLVATNDLPQKIFMLHSFRGDMIRNIKNIKKRPGLAMVQHVDGFGSPAQKQATFHAVAKPKQFFLGFKLFYQADTKLMTAKQVLALRPRVRYVSYQ